MSTSSGGDQFLMSTSTGLSNLAARLRGGQKTKQQHTPSTRKTINSNFLITVNSLKQIASHKTGKRFTEQTHMMRIMKDIFAAGNIEKGLFKFNSYGGNDWSSDANNWRSHIHATEVTATPEFGENKNQLHVHLLFKVQHDSNIHISREFIEQKFLADGHFKYAKNGKPYVTIYNSPAIRIKDYIQKTLDEDETITLSDAQQQLEVAQQLMELANS